MKQNKELVENMAMAVYSSEVHLPVVSEQELKADLKTQIAQNRSDWIDDQFGFIRDPNLVKERFIHLMFQNLQRDRKELFKNKGFGLEFANEFHHHLDKGDHAFFNEVFNQDETGQEMEEKSQSAEMPALDKDGGSQSPS